MLNTFSLTGVRSTQRDRVASAPISSETNIDPAVIAQAEQMVQDGRGHELLRWDP